MGVLNPGKLMCLEARSCVGLSPQPLWVEEKEPWSGAAPDVARSFMGLFPQFVPVLSLQAEHLPTSRISLSLVTP